MKLFGRMGRQKSRQGECKVCTERQLGGAEIYELQGEGGSSLFDVGKAKEIARDGRLPEAIGRDQLEVMVAVNRIEPAHLHHVHPGRPGIVGHRYVGRFLLDGAHRAARSLAEGVEFSAYVLSLEETHSCVISQDIWESDAGLAAREMRQLLKNHPDSDVDVEVAWSDESIQQVRRLLTPKENARVKIRRVGEK